MGFLMLISLCALCLFLGPASPMISQANSAAWAWAGNRSDLGQQIRALNAVAENLVANHAFASGPAQDVIPGWEHTALDPGSTVRTIHLENTPHGSQLLEIVPADGDIAVVSQWIDVAQTPNLTLAFAAHALSTMGDARLYVTFQDASGRHLGTLGWVMVGEFPAASGAERWYDHRTRANFQGGELVATVDVGQTLHENFGVDGSRVARIGLFFHASNGQHLLIESVFVGDYDAQALRDKLATSMVTPAAAAGVSAPHEPVESPVPIQGLEIAVMPEVAEATMGDTFTVTARISNVSEQPLGPLTATFDEPYGYGVVALSPVTLPIDTLAPGATAELTWQVEARRSHAVNLDKPWPLRILVQSEAGAVAMAASSLSVADPRPGRLFYVLTDDLEPMDSAGYPTRYTGNRNGWLDPEEFRIQLIEKSEAMNRIADNFGAKWSHYIAWPVVIGAEWAATQSSTGAWEQVIADLTESVARGAANGHQYSPHLHIDYDVRLPHTLLSYHEPTDGFWANHREHGWAHQIPATGSYTELNSRTGTLFDYMQRMDEILRRSGQGQQLATRTGSFDFGATAYDQRVSIEAFRTVGLWASSDAHGNVGGSTSAPYGQNMYFTRPDSINHRAERLQEIGIVQFLPTPSRAIVFEGETIASANSKVDDAITYYAPANRVRPGVHSIVAFTHAMFLLGDGDWRSTTGGAFSVLDHHLAYVRAEYVENGLIEFGTSNDLIKTWLDYNTPTLLAVRGPEMQREEPGVYEFPIELLGKDIPIGGRFSHEVQVQYPLYLADTIAWVGIYRDGELITEVANVPNADHKVTFTVDGAGDYRMMVIELLEG